MRKILTIAALLLVAATAQGQNNYDNGFKYGLLSNLEVGVGGIYSYEITNAQHHKNAGAQLLVTKRIGDYWRIRGVAEVNGFIPNKFDRFGKGMVGVSFDLLPFYVFADYGANLNPSSKSKFGLAMDGGIGLQFRLGAASLYLEGGVDRTNNGNKWQSNAEVKAGVLVNTGITETDRVRKSIDDNIHKTYGEMKTENAALKSEVDKAANTVFQMEATLAKATALCDQLEAKLNACNNEKEEVVKNCQNGVFEPIYFDYASSTLNNIEVEKVIRIAEAMKETNDTYELQGWCSNNGDDDRNQRLSAERVKQVYWMLVAYGVDEGRLIQSANGKAQEDNYLEQKVVIKRF